MSGSLLLWMTLALTLFWGVGLYNRLMRMRARGLDALRSVEKYMKQYADLVQVHVVAPHTSSPDATASVVAALPPEWVPVLSLLEALEQALKDAKGTPLASEPLVCLGQAFDALQRLWGELRAAPADLAGSAVPDAMQLQWDAVTTKVQTARGGFNQILTKYNHALAQFPARLVVRAMGFELAGQL